jgi:hypothetical protein
LPSTKILTWGVSSFPLGFDFHQKSPKRITPLFLFLHRTSYTNSHPLASPAFPERDGIFILNEIDSPSFKKGAWQRWADWFWV